jgi:hypothetical protein
MNTNKTKNKIYNGADEYFAETLKFKIKSNIYNNLNISVYGLYYGLNFKNLENTRYLDIIKQLNDVFKDNIMSQKEYFKILNRIAIELILSIVNSILFIDIFNTLEKKWVVEDYLLELKNTIK